MISAEGPGTEFNRFMEQCGRAKAIAERATSPKDVGNLDSGCLDEISCFGVNEDSIRYSHQSSEELVILASKLAFENPYVLLGKNARESFNVEQKQVYTEYCSVRNEVDRRDESMGEGFEVRDYLDFS